MIDESALASIERLHKMKSDGIITEADFEKAKADILNGKARTKPASGIALMSSQPERPDQDDHLAWMLLPLKRFADFNGRSGRREFWMFSLLQCIFAFVCITFGVLDSGGYEGIGAIGILALGSLFIGWLAMIVPYFAVQVRRLHDQEKSGWLVLINFIPYLGPFLLLVLMLIPGTKGDNQYGPDPLTE